MNDTCTLTIEPNVSTEDRASVLSGLIAYNRAFVPVGDAKSLAVILRNEDGNVVGGVLGRSHWGWLHIENLWVHEDLRGQGYGQRLLSVAEAEGTRQGCKNVHLTTFSFQALPFYQKNGYVIFGELPEFPEGHTRYFLTKALVREP